MDICILDDDYQFVKVVDTFESFCWTDRYNEIGKFEFEAIADIVMLSSFRKGFYVKIKDSDRLMIIDTIQYTSNVESGDHVKVSGPSLEDILRSRIILKEITLDGPLEEGIMRILNENMIDPEDKNRAYPIITFKKSEDPEIEKLEIHETYRGEKVYDVIEEQAKANNIGFRVLPDYENSGFIFEFYRGVDRSYNQDTLPPVVFSPEYENIVSSNYVDSDSSLINVVYVANDNDGLIMEVYPGLKFDFEQNEDEEEPTEPPTAATGRARREGYVSSSISVPEKTPYGPPESYVERREYGHYETTFDSEAYAAAQERARQRARKQIEAAGGTEADISWPPPGREGQSYEDYCADLPKWPYRKTEYVHDSTWTVAMLSAEERAEFYFKKALADPVTYAKYQMRDEGLVCLMENRTVMSFDGDIINYYQFIIGRDYNLGDIVQMVNGLFVNVATRLTEITYSYDESGMAVVPTFMTDLDIDAKVGV